jgi:NAD(P) transhydrogenase
VAAYDLIVLGTGPAGQKAAISAAKLGKRVAIVERNDEVGGGCLHYGTIPSKTLREAVAYLSGIAQRDLYGASYRVKDHITIKDLTFRTQRVIENEANVVRDQLVRNYVDIITGTGSFVGPGQISVSTSDGARLLEADRVIIATGSRPGRAAGIDFDDRKVIDSDGLLKLGEIPRNITFVGAGIIGIEYATIFRLLGVKVTLIDARPRPLEFLDDEIEDTLYFHMREEGITLRFGETVSTVQHTDDGRVLVTLASAKTLTTDSLMFSAGREGASKDLNLEAIGVETDERGRLKVDQTYQTNVPGVYAVGDVIGFPSLASTSMQQGRLAALYAFGATTPRVSSKLPLGIYTIPEVAMAGPTEQELTHSSVPYEIGLARFRELSRTQITGGRGGLLKLIFRRDNLKLLAVHILGQSATELVHIGQMLIDHEGSVEYFRDAVFNYPTLAEAYKVAALDGLNRL